MASPVIALTNISNSNTEGPAPITGAASNSASGNQQVFLQLLVSQLQNQDPLNPTDSTQFVSELAQFSELEQVIAIRNDIESYHAQAAGQSTSSGQSNPGATANPGQPGSGQTPTITQTHL